MTASPDATPSPASPAFGRDLGRLALAVLAAIAVLHVCAAAAGIALFMDAAYYLLRVMETATFVTIEPTSRTVAWLQQAPVLAAMQAGVTAPGPLVTVSGLANLMLPLAFTVACYWILPRGERALFLFPLLHYLMGAMASWFPTVTDAPPAAAAFWALYYGILFRSARPAGAAVCALLALPALYLHEAFSFLALFLIAAALWRLRSTRDRRVAAILVGLIGWFAYIAFHQARAIMAPRDVNNRTGFLSQLSELQWIYWDGINVVTVLSLLVGLPMLAVLLANLRRGSDAAPRGVGPLTIGWLLALAAAVAWVAVFSGSYGFYTQFAARAQAAFTTVLLAALALASLASPRLRAAWEDRRVLACVGVLGVGVIAGHSVGLARWSCFVDDFRTALSSRSGFIAYDEAVAAVPSERRDHFRHLSSSWINPTVSFLLSEGGTVKAVIANDPARGGWQPFDPCKREELPGGVFSVGPYVAALEREGCRRQR